MQTTVKVCKLEVSAGQLVLTAAESL